MLTPKFYTTPMTSITSRITTWMSGKLAARHEKPVKLTQAMQFWAWAETALPLDAPLRAWLLTLSSEQLQVLVAHVAAYCAQLKVQLAWLLEQRFNITTDLQQATEEIVVSHW